MPSQPPSAAMKRVAGYASVRRLEAIWRGLRRRDVFPITARALLGLIRQRDFLLGSHGLYRLVHTHLPFRNLEEARIPLHIVATDLLSGQPVVLSKGDAATAILASTAIPAAFAPVKFENLYLAGAITSCTPVKVAVMAGATRLIVLPAGYACARDAAARPNALHALTLLISRQVKAELESLDQTIDFHVARALPVDRLAVRLLAHGRIDREGRQTDGGMARRGRARTAQDPSRDERPQASLTGGRPRALSHRIES
jgi:predicted acylesterase/phospholipase RssA